jgi:hypothetical protein
MSRMIANPSPGLRSPLASWCLLAIVLVAAGAVLTVNSLTGLLR